MSSRYIMALQLEMNKFSSENNIWDAIWSANPFPGDTKLSSVYIFLITPTVVLDSSKTIPLILVITKISIIMKKSRNKLKTTKAFPIAALKPRYNKPLSNLRHKNRN